MERNLGLTEYITRQNRIRWWDSEACFHLTFLPNPVRFFDDSEQVGGRTIGAYSTNWHVLLVGQPFELIELSNRFLI